MKYKTGLLFGVFDGLHKGHEFLLDQALKTAEVLYVSVADDQTVLNLKSKAPLFSNKERREALERYSLRIRTLLGDTKLGSWTAIHTVTPNVVFLGYDQAKMKEALLRDFPIREFDVVDMPPFEPETYHTSLL